MQGLAVYANVVLPSIAISKMAPQMGHDQGILDEPDPNGCRVNPLVHLKLVYKVVKKFRWGCSAVIDEDDLFQMGFIGLLAACKKFDPGLGLRFSTFAYRPIEWEIRRGINMSRYGVNVPRGEPVPVGIGTTKGDEDTWAEVLVARSGGHDRRSVLRLYQHAGRALDRRSYEIGFRRLLMEQTLEEIGQRFDISRERVRQIMVGRVEPAVRRYMNGWESAPKIEREVAW